MPGLSDPAIRDGLQSAVTGHCPGILAHFDLADTKRLNSYLGHSAVDLDIDEFTAMLTTYGSPMSFSARIAGDRWAVFLSGTDPSPLGAILARFERKRPTTVGWTATARKLFRWKKKRSSIRDSYLHRSLRCAYSILNTPEQLKSRWKIIEDKISCARVGCPSDVCDDRLFITDSDIEPRWRCIDDKVSPFSCPFCDATQFDWLDGDSTVFGACGICCSCQAKVEFQNCFSFS